MMRTCIDPNRGLKINTTSSSCATGGPNSVLCFELRELVWRVLMDINLRA